MSTLYGKRKVQEIMGQNKMRIQEKLNLRSNIGK